MTRKERSFSIHQLFSPSRKSVKGHFPKKRTEKKIFSLFFLRFFFLLEKKPKEELFPSTFPLFVAAATPLLLSTAGSNFQDNWRTILQRPIPRRESGCGARSGAAARRPPSSVVIAPNTSALPLIHAGRVGFTHFDTYFSHFPPVAPKLIFPEPERQGPRIRSGVGGWGYYLYVPGLVGGWVLF